MVFSAAGYRNVMAMQARVVGWLTSDAERQDYVYQVTPEANEIYRRHNRIPIKLWSLISLAPHAYLFAIASMMDRIDLYLWYRLVPANLMMVTLILWQRVAGARTKRDLEAASSDFRTAHSKFKHPPRGVQSRHNA